jgi:hypothetical protein
MTNDVADKVLRLKDALETVESINNRLNELPKIVVLLAVAVATLGAYDVLWLMLGTVYSQLSFMWGLVVLVLILFTLLYTARRLDKAAEVKGPY